MNRQPNVEREKREKKRRCICVETGPHFLRCAKNRSFALQNSESHLVIQWSWTFGHPEDPVYVHVHVWEERRMTNPFFKWVPQNQKARSHFQANENGLIHDCEEGHEQPTWAWRRKKNNMSRCILSSNHECIRADAGQLQVTFHTRNKYPLPSCLDISISISTRPPPPLFCTGSEFAANACSLVISCVCQTVWPLSCLGRNGMTFVSAPCEIAICRRVFPTP